MIRQDHPRGCGEHFGGCVALVRYIGSSPRMRGAPPGERRQSQRDQIIPADAGSTSTCPFGQGRLQGSSPRMRGARLDAVLGGLQPGIIPADAGSTAFARSYRTLRQDHPRGCGEHDPIPVERRDLSGSSPRMRGAPNGRVYGWSGGGIIPADTGSTSGRVVSVYAV